MYDFDYDDSPVSAIPFWYRLHPAIKSALVFTLFIVGATVLNSLSLGMSLLLCYPLQILIYVANGFLAGYFAIGAHYRRGDLPRIGAIAGALLWILPALLYIIFGVLLGISTLGIGFLSLVTWLVCAPVDLIVQAACGAIGAWLYGVFIGEQAPDEWDSL